jgi:hypothetical protein
MSNQDLLIDSSKIASGIMVGAAAEKLNLMIRPIRQIIRFFGSIHFFLLFT